jgi:hypothetical protein
VSALRLLLIEVRSSLLTVPNRKRILKSYIHGYNHIGLAIAEVKDMLTIAGEYLGQLQLKLNMLSMGHLSPSVINLFCEIVSALRLLLIEVRSSLLTVPNRKLSAFPTIGISPLLYLNFFSTGAGEYLGQLQLKLNMLSMGHLSPSVIDPNNLRILLSDIKSKLPSHLRLPKDEKRDIWQYYQFLTCSTVLEKDRILVILNVPLMDKLDF